jgi:hypothetical protein
LATINSRLSTIKVYAELAMKAGTVDADNYTRIKTVKGYQDKELRRVDDKRTMTRIGKKKAETLLISPEQAAALKQQPNTPQGRRDAVLITMLIDPLAGMRSMRFADRITVLSLGLPSDV